MMYTPAGLIPFNFSIYNLATVDSCAHFVCCCVLCHMPVKCANTRAFSSYQMLKTDTRKLDKQSRRTQTAHAV